MFRTAHLRVRLFAAFMVLTAILAIDGVTGLVSVRSVNNNAKEIGREADALYALESTSVFYSRMRQQVLLMVVAATNPDLPESFGAAAAESQTALDAKVDEYLAQWKETSGLPDSDKAALEAAIASHREVIYDIAVPALSGGTPTVAPPPGGWTLETILGESGTRYAALNEEFERLAGLEQEKYRKALADAQGTYGFAGVVIARRTAKSIADPVADSVDRLRSAADELDRTARIVDEEARTTVDRATTVSAAATQVEANVGTVAAAIEEMRASIGEISSGSQGAARATGEARTRAKSASETVAELGRAAAEITSVAALISDIAEQTNLLALNATIEAARAGEAGRGFAVVANEVKDLAQQTAGATESIAKNVDWIQERTQAAMAAIEEITSVVESVDDLTGQIASAIEEQSATTSEIARSVAEASGAVSEIAHAVVQVEVSAQSTTSSAAEAAGAVQDVRSLAGSLDVVVKGQAATV